MNRSSGLIVLICVAALMATPAAATYCTSWNAGGTSSCTYVYLSAGTTLQATTCSSLQSGAYASGDTYIRLYNSYTGVQLGSTADDYSGCSANSAASYLTYAITSSSYYTITGGCTLGSCSGTIYYETVSTGSAGCTSQYSCNSCTSYSSGCGWCPTSYSCYPTSNYGISASSGYYCSATMANQYGTTCSASISTSCSSYTSCSSCHAGSTCSWCDEYGGYCTSSLSYSSSGCSSSSFYPYYLSCPSSPASSGGIKGKDGYAVSYVLGGISLVIAFTLIIVYSARACSPAACACCTCCQVSEIDKRQPSMCNQACGPMHCHTFLIMIVWPVAWLFVLIAMSVDGWSELKSITGYWAGFFRIHYTGTYGSYSKSYGSSCSNNINDDTLTKSCPALQMGGAFTFLACMAAMTFFWVGYIKFWCSSPYDTATGRTMCNNGKPVVLPSVAHLMTAFISSCLSAILLWACYVQAIFDWSDYNAGQSPSFKLGASWSLMWTAMALAFAPWLVLRREGQIYGTAPAPPKAVPVVPAGAIVVGQNAPQPMQAMPGQMYAQPQPGYMQQPGAYGQPQQAGYAQPYGQQPMYTTQQPMYTTQQPVMMMGQQQPMQPMQPMQGGAMYAQPMYAQQPQPQPQPQPMMGGQPAMGMGMPMSGAPNQQAPPPHYDSSNAAAPPAVSPSAIRVRVPITPPAGLSLPPGAILYNNGDVCDAQGNVLGVVPGLQQAGAPPPSTITGGTA